MQSAGMKLAAAENAKNSYIDGGSVAGDGTGHRNCRAHLANNHRPPARIIPLLRWTPSLAIVPHEVQLPDQWQTCFLTLQKNELANIPWELGN
jgi:hypothetical protein